jgi:MerR family transcriptional regulator, mercuric resistance operon regulatory protein
MPRAMTIGQVAKAAGVNVETVRYYQRRGLVGEPTKPPGGHRHYTDVIVRQIGFIRGAQQLGFSLEEVKGLIKLADGEEGRKVRQLAEGKMETLGTRIAQINRMRRKLRRLIAACKRNPGLEVQAFIANLYEPE